MKPCFTILAIFFVFTVLPVFGQGGNVNLLTAETKISYSTMLPKGDSTYNNYDSLNRIISQDIWSLSNFGTWFLAYRNINMEYDSNGKLLTRTLQQPSGGGMWKDLYRTINTYDSAGHQLSSINQRWDGNTWAPNGSDFWSYDGDGNLLTWNIDNYIRTNYTYNADGLIDIETNQNNQDGDWVDYSRNVYVYGQQSDTQPTLIKIQYWDGNLWLYLRKYTYTYDANGDQISELLQTLGSMNLINESLRTYAYDNNHNIVFSRLQYWENGGWENTSQKFHEYDMESKIRFTKGEIWSNSNNNWVLYNTHRYYYSEIVPTHTPHITDFHVYPNPTSSAVTINGEGLSQVMVFDQQGRLVRTQGLMGQSEETIQLGNIPSGNYYLQVLAYDGKTGIKTLQIVR